MSGDHNLILGDEMLNRMEFLFHVSISFSLKFFMKETLKTRKKG